MSSSTFCSTKFGGVDVVVTDGTESRLLSGGNRNAHFMVWVPQLWGRLCGRVVLQNYSSMWTAFTTGDNKMWAC